MSRLDFPTPSALPPLRKRKKLANPNPSPKLTPLASFTFK